METEEKQATKHTKEHKEHKGIQERSALPRKMIVWYLHSFLCGLCVPWCSLWPVFWIGATIGWMVTLVRISSRFLRVREAPAITIRVDPWCEARV